MVDEQIASCGVYDERILSAMRVVPRHLFGSNEFEDDAYENRPLAISSGQTISQPYIVVLMIQLAQLGDKEKILEIGTGSSYAAAVVEQVGHDAYTIECIEELALHAKNIFSRLLI